MVIIAYFMVRFNVQEEGWNHTDCFLSTYIALFHSIQHLTNVGKKTTHNLGLEDQKRVKLFELRLSAKNFFWNVELPGKAVWIPGKLHGGWNIFILEDDVAQTGYVDVCDSLVK